LLDLLNELSRNQWIVLYLAPSLLCTIAWFVAFVRADDEGGLALTIVAACALGLLCPLILLGIVWGFAGTVDWVAWMWSN